LGRPPRARNEPLEAWHRNLAFAVQRRLEEIVQEMTAYWTRRTGIRTLAISGGVGLNVKMNGNLLTSGLIDDIFVYPICSDSGQAIGAPMALLYERGELQNERLRHLYYGPGFSTDTVETILRGCKIRYRRHPSIETQVARLVSEGKVVGWFQGRMEGGPRALGARSILADPRDVTSRDRVNAVIKYREMWRPFCPSMTEAGARRYYPRHTYAPFMILTFEANERAAREIPAVVHVDGTSRPQIVDPESNPRYHRLLEAFERITGVPVLLNTSFNVKGEPIVCTPQDALRTFFATGMDALAIEDCLILKEEAQPHE
ncbi:MAG: nodulation protein, partial [Deltaproteobacteria bacterium]